MRNDKPSNALMRRSRQLLQLAFLGVAAGTFFAAVGIAMFILPLAPKANDAYRTVSGIVFVLGGGIGLAGLALAVRAVTWRTENDLAKITGQYLEAHFDQRYTFIRNISRFGLGYIDAVLIGPQGVLVFRILDNEGVFLNETTHWLKRSPNGQWVPMRFSPTGHVIDDVEHLRRYMAKQGLDGIPVFGVVVLIGDAASVQVDTQKPTVPVALLPDLLDVLRDNYMAKERIDKQTIDAVVKILYRE